MKSCKSIKQDFAPDLNLEGITETLAAPHKLFYWSLPLRLQQNTQSPMQWLTKFNIICWGRSNCFPGSKCGWKLQTSAERKEVPVASVTLLLQPGLTQRRANRDRGWRAAWEHALFLFPVQEILFPIQSSPSELLGRGNNQQPAEPVQNHLCINILAVPKFCNSRTLLLPPGKAPPHYAKREHEHPLEFSFFNCAHWEALQNSWSGSTFTYQTVKCTFVCFKCCVPRIRYKKPFGRKLSH